MDAAFTHREVQGSLSLNFAGKSSKGKTFNLTVANSTDAKRVLKITKKSSKHAEKYHTTMANLVVKYSR